MYERGALEPRLYLLGSYAEVDLEVSWLQVTPHA